MGPPLISGGNAKPIIRFIERELKLQWGRR